MPTFEGKHLFRAIDNDAGDLEVQAIWRSWVEMVDEFVAEHARAEGDRENKGEGFLRDEREDG